MNATVLVATLLVLSVLGYFYGRRRAVQTAGGRIASLHSVPAYHGLFIALWCGVPALILALLWVALAPALLNDLVLAGVSTEQLHAWIPAALQASEVEGALAATAQSGVDGLTPPQLQLLLTNLNQLAGEASTFVSAPVGDAIGGAGAHLASLRALSGWALFVVGLAIAIIALALTARRIARPFRARNNVEAIIGGFLVVASVIAVLTTLGIVLSLIFESVRFFAQVSITEFLFGIHWSPQTAIRADQVGSSGAFGAVPLFTGTILISGIAMLVAVPIGLMSAIYLSDYAPRGVRKTVKPILEILAGIPTVVYGFFAILTVAPFLRDTGAALGIPLASNSALAAGVVMGIMIVPFVSSLSDDVINAVPQAMRDGSAGLGATKSETIRQVVLPAALPGIVGAVLLAVSRAIGETMIVVMAAGLAANLTMNPFAAVTTVTVQIATLLVGDQEFDSPKTLSVFALGLVLFVVTLMLNIIALRIVQKYREKYE